MSVPTKTLESPEDDLLEVRQRQAHHKKLPRDSFLREVAWRVKEGNPHPPETFQKLIALLTESSGRHGREHILAAWALGEMPLEAEQKTLAAKTLCRIVDGQDVSASQRWKQRFGCALGRVGLLGAGLLSRNQQVQIASVKALGRLRVPKSVSALARAAQNDSLSLSTTATQVLQYVLPTLTPEHYGQLDSDLETNLCQILLTWSDRWAWRSSLVLEILEALRKVGQGHGAVYVRLMVEKARTEEERRIAKEVFDVLSERGQRMSHRNTLLRPAMITAPTSLDAPRRPTTRETET